MGIAGPINQKTFHSEKKKFVLGQLVALGAGESQQGIPIDELNYDELKYELLLASFRVIGVEKDENRWF
ncbi:hypothetical protein AF332_20305 [Sporosarcina globispora]|uniref:Uncharacterized protein n=1 Tax=Sporosarcina globispora TaxID=1459 RepID=A0A0M0GG59_SPOGL|nr:hypothetical protein [Sporosarcina globispora]KON88905.1 hypothetical protein AF332_20305 [Sporosarcina globispora]